MNRRRFLFAFAVACVITLIVDVLLNAVVFRAVFVRAAPYLLPPDQLNARVPFGWGALVVTVAVFGYIQVRGGWVGLAAGLRFGALLAAVTCAGVAGVGSIVAWPAELLIVMAVQQAVNSLVLGAAFGTFDPRSSRTNGG
jgi:hypothetical protein